MTYEVTILNNQPEEIKAFLTTEAPGSHYGVPILRVEGLDVPDLGPADYLQILGHNLNAAGIVCIWAEQRDRTPEEIEAARRFISQWPASPYRLRG